MERARAGTLVTNWAGLAAYGAKYATIPLPELGVSILAEIGAPRIREAEGQVEIPFREIPVLPTWNPATMEAPAPEVIPEFGYSSEVDAPVVPNKAQAARFAGSWETRVGITRPSGAVIDEAQQRMFDGSGNPLPWDAMVERVTHDGTVRYATLAGDHRGRRVLHRHRAFNSDDEGSEWSPIADEPSLSVAAAPDNLATVSGGATGPLGGGDGTATLNVTVRSNSLAISTVLLEKQIGSGSFSTVGSSNLSPDGTVTITNTDTVGSPGNPSVTWRLTARNASNVGGSTLTFTVTYEAP